MKVEVKSKSTIAWARQLHSIGTSQAAMHIHKTET